MLGAKELKHELLDSVMMCWAEYQGEKFPDVSHCLNLLPQIILESGCDNDYKCHHGSRVTNAASSELGDLHRQDVPQRFFPVTEDKMKLMWAEYEQGGIFVFLKY